MTNFKKILLACCLTSMAAIGAAAQTVPTDTAAVDTTQDNRHVYNVMMTARYYGDHVSLRWAPEDYVSWKIINEFGYELIRVNLTDGFVDDTLATCIKPLPQEEFDRMNPADSLAQAASFLLYRRGTRLDETQARPGTMGSVMEVYEEQQNAYGFGMMVAERRFDLAQAMGLGFVDRTVQPGKDYIYILKTLVPEKTLRLMGCNLNLSTAEPYEQPTYEVALTDSIVQPNTILLMWQDEYYSYYNIERRRSGGSWELINEQPYMSMSPYINEEGDDDEEWNIIYSDGGLEPDTYEYRITAFDTFAEQTKPSQPYTVKLPDFVPPAPPAIHRFELDRRLEKDSIILCNVIFSKDSLEADLRGYDIMYTNERFDGTWIKLNDQPVAPTDTVATVDVSKYGSGQIAVVAYDNNGNGSTSAAVYMQVDDLTPPSKPEGLHAMISPEGQVALMWNHCPEPDVELYVGYMSDLPEGPYVQMAPQPVQGDTLLLDTINVRMPKRYKYYRVMAYDYAGNASPLSDVFQLERIDFSLPMLALCDSTWQDGRRFGMRWQLSSQDNIVFSRILRMREDEKVWTVVKTYDLDSIAPVRTVEYVDEPPIDKNRHYRYCVETFNCTGVSSGFSAQKQFLCQGDVNLSSTIRLSGFVTKDTRRPRLAWDIAQPPAENYYFHLYRRYAGRNYRLVATLPSSSPEYEDQRLDSDEIAEYYVTAFVEGGNESEASNVVTLSRNE